MTVIEPQSAWQSWYLAQVRPNCFRIAERNLIRQNFNVFCPVKQEMRRVGRRLQAVDRMLFNGYIFVGFSQESNVWRAVNSTHGISKLVAFGGYPRAVPAVIIENLRKRCDGDGRIIPPENLQTGDAVEIISGPFANFVTTVDRLSSERRVWVLLNILGSKTRVKVSVDEIQKV
jgi:transcriptional antiterminator RfaH